MENNVIINKILENKKMKNNDDDNLNLPYHNIGGSGSSGDSTANSILFTDIELLVVSLAVSIFLILAIYCCFRYRNDYRDEVNRERRALKAL